MNIPVTENADQDLADDDTHDFQVFDTRNPLFVADLVCVPTPREGLFKQWFQVANGKQNVSAVASVYGVLVPWYGKNVYILPLQPKPRTGQHHIPKVIANGRQRVRLEQFPEGTELLLGLTGI